MARAVEAGEQERIVEILRQQELEREQKDSKRCSEGETSEGNRATSSMRTGGRETMRWREFGTEEEMRGG